MLPNLNRRLLLLAAPGALFLGAGSVRAQAGVNGRNVTSVRMSAGRLVLGVLGDWEERGDDGAQFRFRETGRDDWSVYLIDASRGVRLQADLHTRKVRYADSGAPEWRDLYPIVSASAEVNGRNVIEARTATGVFRMRGPGDWEERGRDGAAFRFRESHRDDWSVYLTDSSRGVRLQLDLHTRKVMYADARDRDMRPLYEITGVLATRP